MRKMVIGLVASLAGLLAISAYAADVKSGLQVGEDCGAFQVIDANGPLKGKQHCYV